MRAVYWNRLHVVNLLLSRGANVHQKDRYGCTVLHFAACGGSSDVFPAIFSAAGPRVMNLPDRNGWTPLHLLVDRWPDVLPFVLSHPGIDVKIRDEHGQATMDLLHRSRTALQTYGDQEARWQPIRYTWIKLLMAPARR
jgi:ankyrin repeat protein